MRNHYYEYFETRPELVAIRDSIPPEERCSGLELLIVKIHKSVLLNWFALNDDKKNLSKEHEERCMVG